MEKNYQIIARRFRPQTFQSMVGQEAVVTTLKNSLLSGRLAHAYLFCGSRGTGKTTVARLFAKALNCRQLTAEGEPCNECQSCIEVAAGRSLDVLEIDGASNRGIDDIRQINETVGYAPASGKFKIYIIDEVHMLTKEAFNALLKTLEEPPATVKFFFATTEPHKVLPTIISRCQRYDLNRISPDAMQAKLRQIAEELQVPVEDDALRLIVQLSEGSLRDAESLFDQVISFAEHPVTAAQASSVLGIMPRTSFFQLDQAIAKGNFSFAFELAGQVFSSGKDFAYFLDSLLEHYRNLLLVKLGKESTLAINAAEQTQYIKHAALYSEEQCLYIIDTLLHWVQQVSKSPFKRVSLEMVLLNLLRSRTRISADVLVKRLCELEEKLSSKPQQPVQDPIIEQKPVELPPPAEPSPSLEEKLLTAIKTKIQATAAPEAPASAVQAPLFSEAKPAEPLTPIPENSIQLSNQEQNLSSDDRLEAIKRQSKYDTLIRFAAVELEGSVKKE